MVRWLDILTRETRKHLTIDGEPVVEVDLNASLLTLLSCVVSQPMQCGDTWDGVCGCRTFRFDEPYEVSRAKLGQVIVEPIGVATLTKPTLLRRIKTAPLMTVKHQRSKTTTSVICVIRHTSAVNAQ